MNWEFKEENSKFGWKRYELAISEDPSCYVELYVGKESYSGTLYFRCTGLSDSSNIDIYTKTRAGFDSELRYYLDELYYTIVEHQEKLRKTTEKIAEILNNEA